MDPALLPDLHRTALEEYRFQVLLNWSRSQYLLGFNTGVLAVGAGLLSLHGARTGLPVAAVFAIGAAAAVLSIPVTVIQHGYYRQARDRVLRYEDYLQVPADLRLDSTPGMRAAAATRRLGKITNVLYLLYGLIGALDVGGVVYALVAE